MWILWKKSAVNLMGFQLYVTFFSALLLEFYVSCTFTFSVLNYAGKRYFLNGFSKDPWNFLNLVVCVQIWTCGDCSSHVLSFSVLSVCLFFQSFYNVNNCSLNSVLYSLIFLYTLIVLFIAFIFLLFSVCILSSRFRNLFLCLVSLFL